MTAAAVQRPADLDEGAKLRAFAVSIAVAVLTILDLTKVNVALPSIDRALGAGPTELQVIVAGYALALGLALVPGGRLGDVTSRRRMFVVGLALFTACSLLCAIAPSAGLLLVARFLQGIGAGLQLPQLLGLTQQLYQGADRARKLGVVGATIGVSTALGPTIGGALIALGGEQDGWRLIFWMNVPLGIVLILLVLRFVPGGSGAAAAASRSIDPVGVALLGLGIVAFMLPFVLTTGQRGDSPLRWLALLASAVLLVVFVRWERHYAATGRSPAVDPGLFRRASYRNGLLVAGAWFCAGPAAFLLNTLLLQEGLGIAPVFAGMVTIPFAIASAVSSYVAGRLVSKYGRALVVLGIVIAVVGFLLALAAVQFASAAWMPYLIAAALTIAGVGGGSVVSPNQTLTLSEVPVAEGGVAGSVAQVAQRVGTAIGVAGASAIFFSVLAAKPASTTLDDYRLAVLGGTGLAVVFLLAGLAAALADLLRRRTAPAAQPAD